MPTPLHVVTHKMPTISHLWVYVYSLYCHKKSTKLILSPFSKSSGNLFNPKTGKGRILNKVNLTPKLIEFTVCHISRSKAKHISHSRRAAGESTVHVYRISSYFQLKGFYSAILEALHRTAGGTTNPDLHSSITLIYI